MFSKFLISTAAVVALSGTAFAADLPSRVEPPVYIPPPPVFSWTGVYIGGQIGYQWGNGETVGPFPVTTPAGAAGVFASEPNNSPNGIVGGAHLGYNYQINQFVVGLEGDIEGTGVHRSGIDATGTLSASESIPVQGSVRGRVGVTWDRALLYATGGLAVGDLHASLTNLTTGANDTFNAVRLGWTVGGGVEYAVTNNWLVRAEYRFTDYGTITNVDVNGVFFGGPFTLPRQETNNSVRVGFSYLFTAPPPPPIPVVAKY
jgi:outer membrane immunogenic protein